MDAIARRSAYVYVDIPVFFRPPPGRPGDFLLRGQEKVTKEKATPAPRFSCHPWPKSSFGATGLADAPSMARRQ
ncbi:MAG TPA: hypothetical protein VKV22_07715, partial [Rhodanobacteraceae bacterium]|nr:hypothetical protein [Rhodanobacteraceae bacterium]